MLRQILAKRKDKERIEKKQITNLDAKAEASRCLWTELKNRKVLEMGFGSSRGHVQPEPGSIKVKYQDSRT